MALPHCRRLLFGIGNYFYPNTRQSVGFQTVDKIAKKFDLAWTYHPMRLSWIAEGKDFVLIKPRTYLVEHNIKALYPCIKYYNVHAQNVWVLHHEPALEVGFWRTGDGYSRDVYENEKEMEPINEELQWDDFADLSPKPPPTQKEIEEKTVLQNEALRALSAGLPDPYKRLAIGVKPPGGEYEVGVEFVRGPKAAFGEKEYRELFLNNKFPQKQQMVLDSVIWGSQFEELVHEIFKPRESDSWLPEKFIPPEEEVPRHKGIIVPLLSL